MAKTGCPKQYGLRWEEGWYVQDTEDTDNKNDISNENHLMGSMNTSKLPPPPPLFFLRVIRSIATFYMT